MPLGVLHLLTKLLHQLALSFISVALVHTVKVSAPLFSIIVGRVVLGEVPTLSMVLSVVPIVTGVIFCTNTHAALSSIGLLVALLGTLAIVLQNVFAKKVLVERHASSLALVFYTDVTALVALLPLWLIFEGPSLSSQLMQWRVLAFVFTNGLSSFLQTLVTFFVVVNTTALSYSILTVVKRAFLILGRCPLYLSDCCSRASILYYHDNVTPWHFVGLGISFGGVLWYTRLKTLRKAKVHHAHSGADKELPV